MDTHNVKVTAWPNTAASGAVKQPTVDLDSIGPTGLTPYGETSGRLGQLNRQKQNDNSYSEHGVDKMSGYNGALMFDFGID